VRPDSPFTPAPRSCPHRAHARDPTPASMLNHDAIVATIE
jgi:hypothetical protein